MIHADPTQLEQALINLLRNAVDAAMTTEGDVLAGCAIVVLLTALLLPVLAGARGASEMDVSANNLRIIQQGLVCYAAEWDDRQWTTAPDDLGVFGGDCVTYNDSYPFPPAYLGWGCFEGCDPDYLVDPDACGLAAASLTVESRRSVADHLSTERLVSRLDAAAGGESGGSGPAGVS